MANRSAGAFQCTGGTVRTDILTRIRLKEKTPDILRGTLTKDNKRRLERAATHLAADYGFELTQRQIKDTRDVNTLVSELAKKTGERIHVAWNGERVRLYHSKNLADNYTAYFLPIGPTYEMRPETGALARRLISNIVNVFNIGDITETSLFEEIERMEEEAEEENDGEDQEESLLMSMIRDYKEGTISKRFSEVITEKKPLTLEELDTFVPKTTAEKRLVEAMRTILETLNFNKPFKDYCPLLYDHEYRALFPEYDMGFISIYDTFCITWEDDELFDCIMESLNNYGDCQGVEPICDIREITEDGDQHLDPGPGPFFNCIGGFINALTDIDLTKEEEQEED